MERVQFKSEIPPHENGVIKIVVAPSGTVISLTVNGVLRFSPSLFQPYDMTDSQLVDFDVFSDGSMFALCKDGRSQMWDRFGQPDRGYDLGVVLASVVALSSNLVVFGGEELHLLNLTTEKITRIDSRLRGIVKKIVRLSDTQFAAMAEDVTVSVIDIALLKHELLIGHTLPVTDIIAVNGDVISAGVDGSIWKYHNGEHKRLVATSTPISHVAMLDQLVWSHRTTLTIAPDITVDTGVMITSLTPLHDNLLIGGSHGEFEIWS